MYTNPQKWDETHSQLREVMQKEISAMREILANMHEEELFLSKNNHESLPLLLEKRSELLEHLSTVRSIRFGHIETLKTLAVPPKKASDLPLEEILSIEDKNRCETLLLRDQMIALVERMNVQSFRNKALSQLALFQKENPSAQEQRQRKVQVKTLEEGEEES